jgi:oligoribonuclease (3'-5' exoribonuclease)
MSGLAFVDTETTGLDPDVHQIWEVGLIIDAHPRSAPRRRGRVVR